MTLLKALSAILQILLFLTKYIDRKQLESVVKQGKAEGALWDFLLWKDMLDERLKRAADARADAERVPDTNDRAAARRAAWPDRGTGGPDL